MFFAWGCEREYVYLYIFFKVCFDGICYAVATGSEMRVFAHVDSAVAWLKKKNKTQKTPQNNTEQTKKPKPNSKINGLLVSATPLSIVCSLSLERQPGRCRAPT